MVTDTLVNVINFFLTVKKKNLQRGQTSDYLVLLSHFLPFKVYFSICTLSLPILIKMVDFKNLVWVTIFPTWASKKFIYQGKVGKKVIVIP